MNEFDELIFCQNICMLLREHGEESTPNQVRDHVYEASRQSGQEKELWYHHIESMILQEPPPELPPWPNEPTLNLLLKSFDPFNEIPL